MGFLCLLHQVKAHQPQHLQPCFLAAHAALLDSGIQTMASEPVSELQGQLRGTRIAITSKNRRIDGWHLPSQPLIYT